jgi:hypothetical protein
MAGGAHAVAAAFGEDFGDPAAACGCHQAFAGAAVNCFRGAIRLDKNNIRHVGPYAA